MRTKAAIKCSFAFRRANISRQFLAAADILLTHNDVMRAVDFAHGALIGASGMSA
jgi:uncharacterized protein YqfA (UPF0365 family)